MSNKNGDPKVKIEIRRPRVAGWVGLFTSLSIIILAFFILLNAYSTIDDERVKQAFFSIDLQFAGVFEKTKRLFDLFNAESGQISIENPANAYPGDEMLLKLLRDYYNEYLTRGEFEASSGGMGGRLGMVVTPRGMVITIGESLTFEGSSADLSQDGRNFLDRLAAILLPFRNDIVIEGHTDDQTPTASGYLDNWELSQTRAVNVLFYLNQRGISIDRLSAGGAAQYRPLADNTTAENRLLNRRVEIIIKHPHLRTGD